MNIPQYMLNSLRDLKSLLKQHPTVKREFNKIFSTRTKGRVETLADLSYNSLFNSSIKLSKAAVELLRPHKKSYERLASTSVSLKEKKKLVEAKGHLFAYPLIKVMLPKIQDVVSQTS